MYPVAELAPSKKDPQVTISRPTDSFLEIITIFPDRKIPQCPPFLQFLQQEGEFTKVWGI
jgi:CRISPR-associated protein Cmr6